MCLDGDRGTALVYRDNEASELNLAYLYSALLRQRLRYRAVTSSHVHSIFVMGFFYFKCPEGETNSYTQITPNSYSDFCTMKYFVHSNILLSYGWCI